LFYKIFGEVSPQHFILQNAVADPPNSAGSGFVPNDPCFFMML